MLFVSGPVDIMEYEPSTNFLCFDTLATASSCLPMLGGCRVVLVWLNWFHEWSYSPLLGLRLLSPSLHSLHDITRLRSQCNRLFYKTGLNLLPARISLRCSSSARFLTLLNKRAVQILQLPPREVTHLPVQQMTSPAIDFKKYVLLCEHILNSAPLGVLLCKPW